MARVSRRRAKAQPPLLEPAAYAPGSLARLMAEYLEWGEVRVLSARTTTSRRVLLSYFLKWAEERGLRRPEEVTRSALEQYQRWLHHYRKHNEQALGVVSKQQRVVALRGFFSWCVRAHRLEANPASELDLPKLPPRLPKDVLRAEEVEAVLAQTNLSTALGLRDRATLEVFYATGMRRSELATLRTGDVDLEQGVARIRKGKGGKDRLVPLGVRACRWIARYLEEARPALVRVPDCGMLFLAREGGAQPPWRLTDMVRGYIERAGIEKSGSCHLLRHTMATLMLENGADIRALQEMLGHACLSTTAVYTHLSIQRLLRIHEKTHPGIHPPLPPEEETTSQE